jgi:hypothetical protein
VTLALVLRDAGGLLEDRAAFLRLGRQNLVDLALRHDRVRGPADARVHEKLLDVLEPDVAAVEEIIAAAVARDAAGDLDLVERGAELFLAVGQEQGDLAKLQRLAAVGALENDVLHLAPAQGLGALFPEHPADRVGDVALAAPVGADHRRDTAVEPQLGGVGKAFESIQLERPQMH